MFLILPVSTNPTIRWNSYDAKVKNVLAPFVLVLFSFICLLIGYISFLRSNLPRFSSCKCFMAKNYHMRKRCFQSQYIKWMRLIHLRLICLLARKWSNDLQCLSCIMVSICWEHWSLTHLTPYFISTPPENIRKPGVFWRFQGL